MQEVLTAALAAEWTPKQALILERTENVESVVDAVQRVASHLPQVRVPKSPGNWHPERTVSFVWGGPTPQTFHVLSRALWG